MKTASATEPQLTAVLCGSTLGWNARLAYGNVRGSERHAHGRRLFLPPNQIAAYCVHTNRPRAFIFRTAPLSVPAMTTIPGVDRPVSLLVDVGTKGRVDKLRQLFDYVLRKGFEPSELSDGFYLHVGGLLRGRLPPYPFLPVMLEAEMHGGRGGSRQ